MSCEKQEKKKSKKNKKTHTEQPEVNTEPLDAACREDQEEKPPGNKAKKRKPHQTEVRTSPLSSPEPTDTHDNQDSSRTTTKNHKKNQKNRSAHKNTTSTELTASSKTRLTSSLTSGVCDVSADELAVTRWDMLSDHGDMDLEEQIEKDNRYFMSVINMIPAQFYFDQQTNQEILEMRGGKQKKGKHGKKRQHGSGDGHQASLKRARFDPDSNLTTQQIDARAQHNSKKSPHPAERHGATSSDEIRERLHRRLEELKQKRTLLGKAADKVEKHRLKRRESKLNRKIRLRNEKTQIPKTPKPVNGDVTDPKPIFNKEGKLVYSKFDFTDIAEKEKGRSEFTGKNYQKLLAKVEKRNEQLKKVKEVNPEKGEKLEEKMKWQSALHRAEGIKVKDNPELLRKALKSKEKRKQSKGKKWEARQERTEKVDQERKHKRDVNIKIKKQKMMDRKVSRLKKKGRLIPGF